MQPTTDLFYAAQKEEKFAQPCVNTANEHVQYVNKSFSVLGSN